MMDFLRFTWLVRARLRWRTCPTGERRIATHATALPVSGEGASLITRLGRR